MLNFMAIVYLACLSGAVGSVDVWCARRSCYGVDSNLARGKIFTASISIYIPFLT